MLGDPLRPPLLEDGLDRILQDEIGPECISDGKPTEMISIYYLDMGRLNMDHYCSLGNQPRMVAVPGSDELISFELVGISDMPDENDLHISSHALEFKGPDDLTVYWGATEDRKSFDGSVYHIRRLARP